MKTYHILPEHLADTIHNPWTTALPKAPAAQRLHDCDVNNQWQRVARPEGNDWRDMDRLADLARAAGITWIDCIYGTPAQFASTVTQDAYGFPGGASMPRDVKALRSFVIERLQRFNPKGKKPLITRQQAWNEPRGYLEPSTPAATPDQAAWVVDWANVVKIQRAVWEAAIPHRGVRVLSASMLAGHYTDWVAFIKAGGMNYADDLAIHAYGHRLADFDALLQSARETLDRFGYERKGLALSECGMQPRWSPAFLGLPFDAQVREWANSMLLAASWGCSCFVTYSQDPNPDAFQEVYPMGKVYQGAAALVRPFVGKKIRKAAGWSAAAPAWVIGGRRVVL